MARDMFCVNGVLLDISGIDVSRLPKGATKRYPALASANFEPPFRAWSLLGPADLSSISSCEIPFAERLKLAHTFF